jgi:sulfite reductase (ferredoxin)
MCTTCGCGEPDGARSKVEQIKAASNHLRGALAEELSSETSAFGDESVQLLKFHGVYQQENRDRRKEARKQGLEKQHQMMVRTRIPGGIVPAAAYLAHEEIATRWGDGTLRVTTRQDFQLHGVLKGNLRASIRRINEGLLTTLGGCGDVERNIMCCPAPFQDRLRHEVGEQLPRLVEALAPATGAYHEIWLDGERVATSEPADVEPLYGDSYLPRKFKTAIGLEGDNCVDVHANDLGLVAFGGESGGLAGFNVLVGGGLGRTRNKPDTFAAVAVPIASVAPDEVIEVSRAVVMVQRDHGNRADRRHARLKYLIAARGLDWFRDQVQERVGSTLADPRAVAWPAVADHLGWHDAGEGRWFLGIYVENGRISDGEDAQLRSGLHRIAETLQLQFRLTPQQNVILNGIPESRRAEVEALLRDHGVGLDGAVHPVIQRAMACPALPTCGLAVAESERALPGLIRRLSVVVDDLGLRDAGISTRMTGCPNGCARPYLGDVGLVGTTLGKYDLFLGGDPQGTRLNQLYAAAVPLEAICDLLLPVLAAFARERRSGEALGDWCHRVGINALRERFLAEEGASLSGRPALLLPLVPA